MSGDSPATIANIWFCPFCGKPTHSIQIWNNSASSKNGEASDGYTHYEGGRVDKELVLRIECEETKKDSCDRGCPAASESGAYFLHIYPNGDCHAYYY